MNPKRRIPQQLFTAVLAAVALPTVVAAQHAPAVDVWFDGGNTFSRGESSRLRYEADRGSYVTIVRSDADGRITVLSPRAPNSRSKYTGVGSDAGIPFKADQYDGVGYVFAIASRTPFDFRRYRSTAGGWQMGTLAQRHGVDPFEAVERFANTVVGRRDGYTVAYAPYQIGRGMARGYSRAGVVYDPYDAYTTYPYSAYGDPWWSSPYRDRFDRNRFSRYDLDPRARYDRHCPDGTLVPYTQSCSRFDNRSHRYGERDRWQDTRRNDGRDVHRGSRDDRGRQNRPQGRHPGRP